MSDLVRDEYPGSYTATGDTVHQFDATGCIKYFLTPIGTAARLNTLAAWVSELRRRLADTEKARDEAIAGREKAREQRNAIEQESIAWTSRAKKAEAAQERQEESELRLYL